MYTMYNQFITILYTKHVVKYNVAIFLRPCKFTCFVILSIWYVCIHLFKRFPLVQYTFLLRNYNYNYRTLYVVSKI